MDRLQKLIANIRRNLSGLGPTQKLLIGSLVVIMAMTLFLVSQYAGKPSMVEVWPGSSAEDQARASNFLKTAGVQVVNQSGKTMVPAAQQQLAFATLSQQGQQPSNSAIVFENLLKNQNWINSKEQNRQIYKVMLDNWLSAVLSKFSGVETAKVFVDAPEQVGFAATARPAKASVTIFTAGGKGLDQAAVDAAARMVSGSVAGLELERVSVVVDGRPRRTMRDGDMDIATNRAGAVAIEKQFEEKLTNLLSYIDGVVVAVTATVDTSRTHGVTTKALPAGEGTTSVPKKETVNTTTETAAAEGGATGLRSNVGGNVGASGTTGSRTNQSQEDTEYATQIGTDRKEIEIPAGTPTRLVATIAVPRGFIAGLWQKEQPAAAAAGGGGAAAAAPTAQQIQDQFVKEKASIEAALKPHFKTKAMDGAEVQGDVVVMMVAGEGGSGGNGSAGGGKPGSGGGGGMGGGGTFGTIWAMGGGMIDKVVLGALALVAIGMMALMVRKTGKRVELPSAEELVGLPPTLEAKSDVVGEADESETAMAGIEVGEEEIKSNKMRESVSDFIKQSPDTAAKLLNRWITVGE